MTNFQIAWLVAGAIIGWVGIDIVASSVRATVPYLINFAFAFVGALIAYSLTR